MLAATLASLGAIDAPPARAQAPSFELEARIVAVGIPRIGGVRQIGRFHAGGPIPGNPEFLMQTRPGRILDPDRLMVASGSNFGAPPAVANLAPGAVLSLAANSTAPLVIPPGFAVSGGQSSAADGAIQLYSAQNAAFLNRIHNRAARTAELPAVAGPRYISINNAFGRPWIANAPAGAAGVGLNTVLDPNGRPLDNAPSSNAGGVFAGSATNRMQTQHSAGDLAGGALGTAFLGPSPDATGFAVFAVAKADGSVVQIHVQDGVDGLAASGTIGALELTPETDPDAIVGMAFNWVPDRILFIADRKGDRIARLRLADDSRHFTVAALDYLAGKHFNGPSDIAPAIPEIANPRFSSHTTLAGNSDLYVANRGDGSLLRITQDGALVARARVLMPDGAPIAAARLRGIAVSADAQRLWLTIDSGLPSQPGLTGAVIEVSGFDARGPFRSTRIASAASPAAAGASAHGESLFAKTFSPADGLGPLFNARACTTCHNEPGNGGMSSRSENFALRVAQLDPSTGRVTPVRDFASPIAPRHSIHDLGVTGAPSAGIPSAANVVSMRMPTALYGLGILDQIPDEAILAHAVAKGDGIRGRPNRVITASGERRIGRYGWKADVATLPEMVASAFANEMGITSPLAPERGESGVSNDDADGSIIAAVASFLRGLGLPLRQAAR